MKKRLNISTSLEINWKLSISKYIRFTIISFKRQNIFCKQVLWFESVTQLGHRIPAFIMEHKADIKSKWQYILNLTQNYGLHNESLRTQYNGIFQTIRLVMSSMNIIQDIALHQIIIENQTFFRHNSSSPSDASMRQQTASSLVQIIGLAPLRCQDVVWINAHIL